MMAAHWSSPFVSLEGNKTCHVSKKPIKQVLYPEDLEIIRFIYDGSTALILGLLP